MNRFPKDTEGELDTLRTLCEARGEAFALSEAYAKGGEGAEALVHKVVEVIEANPFPELTTTYSPTGSAEEKITKVARQIYGASDIALSEPARQNLARFTRWGFGHLPICIARTQYSLTDEPKRLGAPTGWTMQVTDVSLSAGAGFLVVISGAMMLMLGLPKVSRAVHRRRRARRDHRHAITLVFGIVFVIPEGAAGREASISGTPLFGVGRPKVAVGARALRFGQAGSRHNSLRSAFGIYSVSHLTCATRSGRRRYSFSVGKVFS